MFTFIAQATCDPSSGAGKFFNLPHWYEYLSGEIDPVTGKCIPTFNFPADTWHIALAIVDILLRVGGLLAVAYVIYGSFRYIISQGEPDQTAAAKSTILNALIGLVIVMFAIIAVSFVGRSIK